MADNTSNGACLPGRRRRHLLALVASGCLLAAVLAVGAAAADPTFTAAPGSPIATGSGSISTAIADLNGDGSQDLAVANQGDNNVRILLGNGSGGFSNATGSPVAVGTDPVGVVAANLNGSGGLDLAVANENATGVGSVSILLGNGTGGFSNAGGSPVTTGPTGSAPQAIAVADLNGSAGLDLAVANEGTNNVTILLGNGTGGFAAAAGSPVAVGSLPQALVAGYFNADSNTDLAVANEVSGNVSILFGNGTGGFPTSATVAAGADPNDIANADLNGDSRQDLVVANAAGDNVSILLGNGSGGFSNAPGSPVAVGASPEGIAVADYNLDSKLDLAVANAGGTTMSILVGNGLGGFTAAPSVPAGTDPTGIAAGNLNADTKPDLAVANYASGNTTVALNTTPAQPTAVTLRAFVARRTSQGVELRWRTGQETALIGFEVYRDSVRLNRSLIRAKGAHGDAQYRLMDRSVRTGAAATYRLRAVKRDGMRVWLGTAAVPR